MTHERWKDFLGQFEVLKTYYARLTERERYIVLGIAGGAILLVFAGIYLSLLAATAKMDTRIAKSRDSLRELAALRTEYAKTEQQINEFERIIQRTDPDFQLATELEKLGRRHGVNIDSLKDRAGPPNDLYRETQAAVSVKEITLQSLINYLFDIEHSKALLRITSLKVKPNFRDPTQLNVDFIVSTFQPVSSR